MEPEDGTETESEPGDRGCGGDGEDGVEDWDGVGNDKNNDPVQSHADDPDTPGLDASVGDLVGGLESSHSNNIHVFDASVS